MGRIVTVASGKGGVGKTTIAGNIARAIADGGNSVLLIDADPLQGGLDLTLGIKDGLVFDIIDVLSSTVRIDQAIVRVLPDLDLFFLPLSVSYDTKRKVTHDEVKLILEALSGKFDFVFVDCAAGNTDEYKFMSSEATDIIIVATPDQTSVRDARRLALDVMDKNPLLVINRVKSRQILQGVAPDVDFMIDEIGARLIGIIPEDIAITACQNTGVLPIDTNSLAAFHMKDTAERLLGNSVKLRKVK